MRDLWRSRTLAIALLALALPAIVSAQDMADPPVATPAAEEAADEAQQPEQLRIMLNGVFNTWFQRQEDFFFGRAEYSDRYVVQMLRLGLTFAWGENIRAVTRFDMAQGWWGVNNASFRDDWREGNQNASNRWANKDTNYPFHVDHAFVEFKLPNAPVTARVGRMYWGPGSRIILDSNFDGVQVDFGIGASKLGVSWAKVSEGAIGLHDFDPENPAAGGVDGRDADIFTASFGGRLPNTALNYTLFGLHYRDLNAVPYMPVRWDYMIHRFTPAVSQATALGLNAAYNFSTLGLRLDGEVSYLMGKDEYERTSSLANQLLDINNGELSGYNLFARATKTISPRLEVAGLVGMGSGDDDVMSGRGNLTKLKTMGFFYLTDVWEQSIMPDEEGITPQGLGAPNVRGYRELENTTILQANTTFKPIANVRLHLAYSFLRATQPIQGWDRTTVNGVITPADMTGEFARDIGQELGFLVGYQPYPRLDLVVRGGYFLAGEGAHLLVNGNTNYDARNPWQLKGIVEYRFDNTPPAPRVSSR
jgi:hypothetical protein